MMIDLGRAEQWSPPETARPRRRLTAPGRLALALLVLAGVAAVPVRSAPAPAPVLHIGTGGAAVMLGGGRIYVVRAQQRLEVYSAHGAPFWSRTMGDTQQLDYADTDVAVFSSRGEGVSALDTVNALDPGTGVERWARGGGAVAGRAGRLVILIDTSQWQPDRPPPPLHVIAVHARTGATVWDLAVPADSVGDFGRPGDDTWDLVSFSVLDPDGTLRDYDLATGAVARTGHLPRTGPAGSFTLGPAGRQVAVAAGGEESGDDVYDRATGQFLWHAGAAGSRLDPCAPQLWCRPADGGLLAFDAATGRPAWRADGFDAVLAAEGPAVVLGHLGQSTDAAAAVVVVVDARTGAQRVRLDGWHPVRALGGRLVVWHRPEGARLTTVGLFDPVTGRVAVVGTGDAWGGWPVCTADVTLVACGVVGDLTVWPLPAAARR
ncbi:PQQ-binding-like beta-propeller repeat protein [Dactylosporangium sp. NPDC051541]|uniref:outer membrane protein assembly factor BamB family protein n=1 Tax=Dactylosporangium sp. NPDC051541 TaxID=3363977 RepID=UPI003791BFE3